MGIDRNGEAFGVILEYLRSGQLIFSSKVPLALIRAEAEYYSLINVVEAIDSHKECKGISDDENIRDIPRIDGFYTNNRTGDSLKVIHFRGKGKLTFLEGDSARN